MFSKPLPLSFRAQMPMILRLITVRENARSALECGSSSYRRADVPHEPKAVAAATALQGAFGTSIFMASEFQST